MALGPNDYTRVGGTVVGDTHPPQGGVLSTNFTAWGWLHIVLGIVCVYAVVVHGRDGASRRQG